MQLFGCTKLFTTFFKKNLESIKLAISTLFLILYLCKTISLYISTSKGNLIEIDKSDLLLGRQFGIIFTLNLKTYSPVLDIGRRVSTGMTTNKLNEINYGVRCLSGLLCRNKLTYWQTSECLLLEYKSITRKKI